jgi:hypothetical protein
VEKEELARRMVESQGIEMKIIGINKGASEEDSDSDSNFMDTDPRYRKMMIKKMWRLWNI